MASISLLLSWPFGPVILCVATMLVYLMSLLRRPSLREGAPKLAHGWPFLGSIGFYQSRQQFMTSEKEKTASGQFSFTYGPFNIIALSGHEARDSFYSSRSLDLLSAYVPQRVVHAKYKLFLIFSSAGSINSTQPRLKSNYLAEILPIPSCKLLKSLYKGTTWLQILIGLF